jgi:putative ABC transport system permease protein
LGRGSSERSRNAIDLQVNAARQAAVTLGTTIESKSGQLSLGQISDGATLGGILLALGVLAMTVGLIRSETASDLRTLTATGRARAPGGRSPASPPA